MSEQIDGRRINIIARLAKHSSDCGATWNVKPEAAAEIHQLLVELLSLREQIRQAKLALGVKEEK